MRDQGVDPTTPSESAVAQSDTKGKNGILSEEGINETIVLTGGLGWAKILLRLVKEIGVVVITLVKSFLRLRLGSREGQGRE